MNRRNFIKRSAITGSLVGAVGTSVFGSQLIDSDPQTLKLEKFNFKLNYAPHFGMFENHAGKDLLDQLQFIADAGFHAFEDNGMKGRSVQEQEKIAKKMTQLGLKMGVFVVNSNGFGKPSFSSGDPVERDVFLKEVRESVEVAKRVNAKWMTVVCGDLYHKLEMAYQTANVVDTLRKAAEIFEPHGLVMVLEPLNPFSDHPNMFLSKVPQAYLVCKAVNSPACKILDDLYHQQITEGNLIPNIDKAYDEIGYFQIGDNPGRKEPTTGEINYLNVFKHIKEKGFTGILGMEHGNSKSGKDGELALIEAYKKVDSF